MSMPFIEVYPTENEKYSWRLKAANGDVVAQGNEYPDQTACEQGCAIALERAETVFHEQFRNPGEVIHFLDSNGERIVAEDPADTPTVDAPVSDDEDTGEHDIDP